MNRVNYRESKRDGSRAAHRFALDGMTATCESHAEASAIFRFAGRTDVVPCDDFARLWSAAFFRESPTRLPAGFHQAFAEEFRVVMLAELANWELFGALAPSGPYPETPAERMRAKIGRWVSALGSPEAVREALEGGATNLAEAQGHVLSRVEADGVVFAEGMTYEEFLRDADIDFPVALEPMYWHNPTTGNYEPVPNWVLTTRTDLEDVHSVMGVASDNYSVVPYSWVMELVREIARNSEAIRISASSSDNGARMFAAIRTAAAYTIDDDEIGALITVTASHDRSGAVSARLIPIMTSTGLALSSRELAQAAMRKVRHTGNATDKVDSLRQVVVEAERALDAFAKRAAVLAKTPIVDRSDALRQVVTAAFGGQDHKANLDREATLATRLQGVADARYHAQPSWWDLYIATVASLPDHVVTHAGNQAWSDINGAMSKKVDKVWERINKLADSKARHSIVEDLANTVARRPAPANAPSTAPISDLFAMVSESSPATGQPSTLSAAFEF